MPHRLKSTFAISLLLLGCFASSARAVFVPGGLNPGDTYQLVFVTRGWLNPLSTNIDDYNAFVQAEAALNAPATGTDIGVQWRAIGSTQAVAARDNALVAAPVYTMGNALVANGFADFWSVNHLVPIDVDQFQVPLPQGAGYDYVWTGMDIQGYPFLPWALGGPSGDRNTKAGATHSVLSWSSGGLFPAGAVSCGMYGLSEVLTVPQVPEPSTMVLACIAATGAVGQLLRGRRRRKS